MDQILLSDDNGALIVVDGKLERGFIYSFE
jgi:hypothetical protein